MNASIQAPPQMTILSLAKPIPEGVQQAAERELEGQW